MTFKCCGSWIGWLGGAQGALNVEPPHKLGIKQHVTCNARASNKDFTITMLYAKQALTQSK